MVDRINGIVWTVVSRLESARGRLEGRPKLVALLFGEDYRPRPGGPDWGGLNTLPGGWMYLARMYVKSIADRPSGEKTGPLLNEIMEVVGADEPPRGSLGGGSSLVFLDWKIQAVSSFPASSDPSWDNFVLFPKPYYRKPEESARIRMATEVEWNGLSFSRQKLEGIAKERERIVNKNTFPLAEYTMALG